MQEIQLDKHVKLLDCPGIVMATGSSDTQIILKNVVRVCGNKKNKSLNFSYTSPPFLKSVEKFKVIITLCQCYQIYFFQA